MTMDYESRYILLNNLAKQIGYDKEIKHPRTVGFYDEYDIFRQWLENKLDYKISAFALPMTQFGVINFKYIVNNEINNRIFYSPNEKIYRIYEHCLEDALILLCQFLLEGKILIEDKTNNIKRLNE